MYNKTQFKKINDKKVLHKVKKHWVTISIALLGILSGGAAATHVNASANTITNTNVNDDQANHQLNMNKLHNNQDTLIKDQERSNSKVSASSGTRTDNNYSSNDHVQLPHSNDLRPSLSNTPSNISHNIGKQADALHSHIIQNANLNYSNYAYQDSMANYVKTGGSNDTATPNNEYSIRIQYIDEAHNNILEPFKPVKSPSRNPGIPFGSSTWGPQDHLPVGVFSLDRYTRNQIPHGYQFDPKGGPNGTGLADVPTEFTYQPQIMQVYVTPIKHNQSKPVVNGKIVVHYIDHNTDMQIRSAGQQASDAPAGSLYNLQQHLINLPNGYKLWNSSDCMANISARLYSDADHNNVNEPTMVPNRFPKGTDNIFIWVTPGESSSNLDPAQIYVHYVNQNGSDVTPNNEKVDGQPILNSDAMPSVTTPVKISSDAKNPNYHLTVPQGYSIVKGQHFAYNVDNQPQQLTIHVEGNEVNKPFVIYRYERRFAQPDLKLSSKRIDINSKVGSKVSYQPSDFIPKGYKVDTLNSKDHKVTITIGPDRQLSSDSVTFFYLSKSQDLIPHVDPTNGNNDSLLASAASLAVNSNVGNVSQYKDNLASLDSNANDSYNVINLDGTEANFDDHNISGNDISTRSTVDSAVQRIYQDTKLASTDITSISSANSQVGLDNSQAMSYSAEVGLDDNTINLDISYANNAQGGAANSLITSANSAARDASTAASNTQNVLDQADSVYNSVSNLSTYVSAINNNASAAINQANVVAMPQASKFANEAQNNNAKASSLDSSMAKVKSDTLKSINAARSQESDVVSKASSVAASANSAATLVSSSIHDINSEITNSLNNETAVASNALQKKDYSRYINNENQIMSFVTGKASSAVSLISSLSFNMTNGSTVSDGNNFLSSISKDQQTMTSTEKTFLSPLNRKSLSPQSMISRVDSSIRDADQQYQDITQLLTNSVNVEDATANSIANDKSDRAKSASISALNARSSVVAAASSASQNSIKASKEESEVYSADYADLVGDANNDFTSDSTNDDLETSNSILNDQIDAFNHISNGINDINKGIAIYNSEYNNYEEALSGSSTNDASLNSEVSVIENDENNNINSYLSDEQNVNELSLSAQNINTQTSTVYIKSGTNLSSLENSINDYENKRIHNPSLPKLLFSEMPNTSAIREQINQSMSSVEAAPDTLVGATDDTNVSGISLASSASQRINSLNNYINSIDSQMRINSEAQYSSNANSLRSYSDKIHGLINETSNNISSYVKYSSEYTSDQSVASQIASVANSGEAQVTSLKQAANATSKFTDKISYIKSAEVLMKRNLANITSANNDVDNANNINNSLNSAAKDINSEVGQTSRDYNNISGMYENFNSSIDASVADSAAKSADNSIANYYRNSVSNSVSVANRQAASSAAKSTDDSIANYYKNSISNSVSVANRSVANSAAKSANSSIADYYKDSVSNSVSVANRQAASSAAKSADDSIVNYYRNSVSASVSMANHKNSSSDTKSITVMYIDQNGSEFSRSVAGVLNQSGTNITQLAKLPLGYQLMGGQNVNYRFTSAPQTIKLRVIGNQISGELSVNIKMFNDERTSNFIGQYVKHVPISGAVGNNCVINPQDYTPSGFHPLANNPLVVGKFTANGLSQLKVNLDFVKDENRPGLKRFTSTVQVPVYIDGKLDGSQLVSLKGFDGEVVVLHSNMANNKDDYNKLTTGVVLLNHVHGNSVHGRIIYTGKMESRLVKLPVYINDQADGFQDSIVTGRVGTPVTLNDNIANNRTSYHKSVAGRVMIMPDGKYNLSGDARILYSSNTMPSSDSNNISSASSSANSLIKRDINKIASYDQQATSYDSKAINELNHFNLDSNMALNGLKNNDINEAQDDNGIVSEDQGIINSLSNQINVKSYDYNSVVNDANDQVSAAGSVAQDANLIIQDDVVALSSIADQESKTSQASNSLKSSSANNQSYNNMIDLDVINDDDAKANNYLSQIRRNASESHVSSNLKALVAVNNDFNIASSAASQIAVDRLSPDVSTVNNANSELSSVQYANNNANQTVISAINEPHITSNSNSTNSNSSNNTLKPSSSNQPASSSSNSSNSNPDYSQNSSSNDSMSNSISNNDDSNNNNPNQNNGSARSMNSYSNLDSNQNTNYKEDSLTSNNNLNDNQNQSSELPQTGESLQQKLIAEILLALSTGISVGALGKIMDRKRLYN